MIGTENEPIYVVDSFSMIHAAYVGWRSQFANGKNPALIPLRNNLLGTFECILNQLHRESNVPFVFEGPKFMTRYIAYDMVETMFKEMVTLLKDLMYVDVIPGPSVNWFAAAIEPDLFSLDSLSPGSSKDIYDKLSTISHLLRESAEAYTFKLKSLHYQIQAYYKHSIELEDYFEFVMKNVSESDFVESELERDYENFVEGNPTLKKSPEGWGKLRALEIKKAQNTEDKNTPRNLAILGHNSSNLLIGLQESTITPFFRACRGMMDSNGLSINTAKLEMVIFNSVADQHRENLLVCKMFPEKTAEYEAYLRKLRGEDEPTEAPELPREYANATAAAASENSDTEVLNKITPMFSNDRKSAELFLRNIKGQTTPDAVMDELKHWIEEGVFNKAYKGKGRNSLFAVLKEHSLFPGSATTWRNHVTAMT